MRHTFSLASMLVATAAAIAAPASAEGSDQAAAGADLVVTAQRLTQRLQDVPVSVTALDSRGLERRGVQSLDNLAKYTPNLRFDGSAPLSGGAYNATIFIRGVGQNDFAIFSDPGVGVYVDDVYYARSIGGVLDAVDLASVQVLRGPQGTLFGKNTIGGAVIVTTRKPTDDFSVELEATTGSFSRADGKAVLNAPLANGAAAWRFTFATFHRDGFVKRLADGSDQGNRNSMLMRGQLRITPSDRIVIDLAGDYTRAREHQAQNNGDYADTPRQPSRH